MKKILKNNIFGFIIGLIVMSGISITASSLYSATAVSYNFNSNETVQTALDDLYEKSSAKVEMIYVGKFNGGVSNQQYDISALTDKYGELSIDNFYIKNIYANQRVLNEGGTYYTTSQTYESAKSLVYNTTTGILTASGRIGIGQYAALDCTSSFDIYVLVN